MSSHDYEDHLRGPYSSREIAEKKVEEFKDEKTFTGEHIRSGLYEIIKRSGEKLPDGRIICGERVFPGFGDSGNIHDYFNKYLLFMKS